MRRFNLIRYTDITGVSGIGNVAEGIVFSDGTVVMRWKSKIPTTTIYNSLENLLAIHDHRVDVAFDKETGSYVEFMDN